MVESRCGRRLVLRSLHARGRRRDARDLPDRRAAEPLRHPAAAVHAADPAREPPPPRGRRDGHARGRRGRRDLERRGRAVARDHLRARPRAPPGLHRRAGGGRPRRHARRDERPGRRPGAHQPAAPGGARHRPLGAGGRVRDAVRDHPQRRARVRAQPRALRLPALGPAGVPQLPGRPAEHRHRPPGQPRVPRPRGRGARRAGVPGHARRHRLAHDDGQRPRRARLGRRGHRGRGGDARRGDLDARPAGRRLQADRRAAGGRDGDRPRPDGDADAAQRRRGRASSSSTTATASSACRSPTGRPSGTCRPEYGATCGFFPVDEETLRYLRLTGRSAERIELVEAYCREQRLFHDPDDEPTYSQVLELDLGDVEPSLAGPRRPQDRVPLAEAKNSFLASLETFGVDYGNGTDERSRRRFPRATRPSSSIPPTTASESPNRSSAVPVPRSSSPSAPDPWRSSSTASGSRSSTAPSSSPPSRAARTHRTRPSWWRRACSRRRPSSAGSARKPWVKSSLAPGSKVVTEYYDRAGLTPYLEELGFHTVGYGCTTCIGNSGPLPEAISAAVSEGDLVVCSVLSGNRNFEARIHPEVKANYLASPPLVVAYALAGRMDLDLTTEPLGQGSDGEDVYLRDLWPTRRRRSTTRSASPCEARCSSARTPTCTRATSAGDRSRCPTGTASSGSEARPTCSVRPTSRA